MNKKEGTNILRLTDDEFDFLKLILKLSDDEDNEDINICCIDNDEFDDLGICARYECDNCPLKTIQKKLRRKNKRISTDANGLMPFVRTKTDLPKVKLPKEK